MQYGPLRFVAIATTTAQSLMFTNPSPAIPRRPDLRKREADSSFPKIRLMEFAPMMPLVAFC
jgi:hypothetical protein